MSLYKLRFIKPENLELIAQTEFVSEGLKINMKLNCQHLWMI